MANATQILDKVTRNMEQRGYWNPGNPLTPTNPHAPTQIAQVGSTVQFTKADSTVLTISYLSKSVQSPMGGIDPTVSPFLGIGIAAPGSLLLKGAAGQNTIAAIISDAGAAELMVELAGYANTLVIQAGDTTTNLATIRGDESALGMGS